MFTTLSPELEKSTTYLKIKDWYYRVTTVIPPIYNDKGAVGGSGLFLIESFRRQGLTITNKYGLNHFATKAYIGEYKDNSYIDVEAYTKARQTMVDKIIDFQTKRIANPNE